jgi:hypothetical protein
MSVLLGVGRAAAGVGGQVLRVVIVSVAALRPAPKPLHPEGTVRAGVLRRFGSTHPSGASWLDEVGEDPVLVRRSRSVGLPDWAPDVLGLAVRVPTADGGYGDLLFGTTGLGRLSRFLVLPSRSAYDRPMSTLLPYRTPSGPVLLAAEHRDAGTVDLSWARGTGRWRRFATLRVSDAPAPDADVPISFDVVLNTLPGLGVYDWVRRLREPSYRAARRSRGLPG